MNIRRRSQFAGRTDYTGVSMAVIIDDIRDWRTETERSIQALNELTAQAEQQRECLDRPHQIVGYARHFIDLLGRYLGDFDRLLAEMPNGVTDPHVEIVRQITNSASQAEDLCIRFSQDHIDRELIDESLRGLVDEIYVHSRGMLIDYQDLSNLVPRLRTFVGSLPKNTREREQKFGILYSLNQARRDFDSWTKEGATVPDYAIAVMFLDIDDFKSLNSRFTESLVDQGILPRFQEALSELAMHRGAAYRHGGEEFLMMLPNASIEESTIFAKKILTRVDGFSKPRDSGFSALLKGGFEARSGDGDQKSWRSRSEMGSGESLFGEGGGGMSAAEIPGPRGRSGSESTCQTGAR